jgi:hypothetical protein
MFPFRFKSSLILPRNLERYGYEEYVGLYENLTTCE